MDFSKQDARVTSAHPATGHDTHTYDFVVIGSGFGGSVAALRLAEKGYRVCVLEQGRRFAPQDFPKTNWNLKKWLWMPIIGFYGPFKMTFLRHLTVFSGVGVGGGSLVYGNTLPVPKTNFFASPSWSHLADWAEELKPFYTLARRMLGAVVNPHLTETDRLMGEVAADLGLADAFQPTEVAVYFGADGEPPGTSSPDPYFGGEGPTRHSCQFCGACMTGCRYNAKNTLDRNYLYLAERKGAKISPLSRVISVKPLARNQDRSQQNLAPNDLDPKENDRGFQITYISKRIHSSFFSKLKQLQNPAKNIIYAKQVVFAAGVLGTLRLLLNMQNKADGLPRLSPTLGTMIRTNSESIIAVTTSKTDIDFSQGIAISSIIQTDENSHVEPVRYGKGSGFFRILVAPHGPGGRIFHRLGASIRNLIKEPLTWVKVVLTPNFSQHTQIMLYMRSMEGTLAFKEAKKTPLSFSNKNPASLRSYLPPGTQAPQAFIPEATDLAQRFAAKVQGVLSNIWIESFRGTPSTAHILGGCCMGANAQEGVIDRFNQVFGYPGLYVVDGSAISANPGVNPSLTITALAERAMSFIPARQ